MQLGYRLKLCLAVLWAVPWCILALLCLLTLVLAPLGFMFWVIACYPYKRIWQKHFDEKYAYANRDRPLEGEDAEVPWLT